MTVRREPSSHRGGPQSSGPERITVGNEFAEIELRVESEGNGLRLLAVDQRSGESRLIDVLVLEGLIEAPDAVHAALADPGLDERLGFWSPPPEPG